MRTLFAALALATATLMPLKSTAQEAVVVELFTSQGCSSCPPADKLLGEIANRDDVLALALHVDYWDYIGWKDSFADPDHTTRQRAYSRAAGLRTIWTPQMVIGGEDHVIGSKPMQLADTINAHLRTAKPVELSVTRNGSQLEIVATPRETVRGDVLVQIFRYSPEETVSIRRGENAGRTLTYHNVVTGITEVGTWNGQGTYRATGTVEGNDRFAVILQRPNSGPVLAAAKVR